MHPEFRAAFNVAFTDELASSYAGDLVRRTGCEPGFRLAETPVFLTGELTAALEEGAHAIVAQLAKPEALVRMKRAIPERWATPGMDALPSLAQVDFAIVKGTTMAVSCRGSSSCRGFLRFRPLKCFSRTRGATLSPA